jgi:hypothetical protein
LQFIGHRDFDTGVSEEPSVMPQSSDGMLQPLA